MRSKKIFYSILTFIISIGLFSSCSYSDNQFSQKYSKSLMVKGNAVINVKPDTAILKLDINLEGKKTMDIKLEYSKMMDNIVNYIVKLGTDKKDIYIDDYNLHPSNNYESKNPFKIENYGLYTTLSIKVNDINKIGEIVTEANNEAKKFGGNISDIDIKFTVNNYDKYYKEALKNAIEDGNKKAKELSKGLGIDLESVVKIDENQEYTDDNENNNFKNINYGEKSNNIIEANKLIKASVNMTFEY